ncbi:SseB family protein [Eggerthia catenaformis]|uniref:SseB family protein n=1 Tax=Eggerthia catenaformis TaxID=31973 RepID=UPI00248E93B3|nr:SseB family protein [Eggerthia catenaformis]
MEQRNLDNRRIELLLDYLSNQSNEDYYEQLFTYVAESSYFYVLVSFSKRPVAQKDGSYLLQDDTNISFPVLTNSRGKYYPVFTSLKECEKWIEYDVHKATVLTLCIDDFIDILNRDTKGMGIVINAFNQSFIISKEMLIHLKKVRDQNHPIHRHTIFEHLK